MITINCIILQKFKILKFIFQHFICLYVSNKIEIKNGRIKQMLNFYPLEYGSNDIQLRVKLLYMYYN